MNIQLTRRIKTDPVKRGLNIGSEEAKPPSAHRTVRTGPYTAPHASLTHCERSNQCESF